MHQKINLLPEHIIDQIKAGEVIERPSSLIKELLENALDADANSIKLHITDNALDTISIEDNGSGISFIDLPYAFTRHATSKLKNFNDLYQLYTYGFRGEALASIASISKIKCVTTTEEETSILVIEGGNILLHEKKETKEKEMGTKIFIKDLFYNTPVRAKFLNSEASEKNQLKKIIHSFLLNSYNVHFEIKWDKEEKTIFEKKETKIERIKEVILKESDNQNILHLKKTYDGTEIEVFITHKSSRGNAGKLQYIFANERYIHEISLHKILINTSEPLWQMGEAGHYALFITVPPEEIDINVHPNKTTIKFFKIQKIQSLLSGMIKDALKKEESPYSARINHINNEFIFKDKEENYKKILSKEIHYKSANESLDLVFPHKTSIRKGAFLIYQESEMSTNLINLKKLIIYFYKNIFYKQDSDSSPLLISKMIKDKNEILSLVLPFINNSGFYLKKINNEDLLLRSVPSKTLTFPHHLVFDALIKNNEKIKDLDHLFFILHHLELELDLHNYEELIKLTPKVDLIKEKISKEITETLLKDVFEDEK